MTTAAAAAASRRREERHLDVAPDRADAWRGSVAYDHGDALVDELQRIVDLIAGHLIEGLGWEEAADLLKRLAELRREIRSVEDELTDVIVTSWRRDGLKGHHEVTGVGTVSLRAPYKRTRWNHEAVAREVVDRQIAASGGEVPDPYDLVHWLLTAAQVSYWRTRLLRSLGIEPDDFCDSELGRPSVSIRP